MPKVGEEFLTCLPKFLQRDEPSNVTSKTEKKGCSQKSCGSTEGTWMGKVRRGYCKERIVTYV